MSRPISNKSGMLRGFLNKDSNPVVWGRIKADFYRTPKKENLQTEATSQVIGGPSSPGKMTSQRSLNYFINYIFGLGPDGD